MDRKRTQFNFDTHVLETVRHDGIVIHSFQKPNTSHGRIKFINACGVLSVTGDFGNWIFCREFHPDRESTVSDQYWMEKLCIGSTQNPYDPNEKRKTHAWLLCIFDAFEDISARLKQPKNDIKN